MARIPVKDRDSTAECQAKIPPAYRPIRRVGDPNTHSGAAFLCLENAACGRAKAKTDSAHWVAGRLRRQLRIVKVANGRSYREDDVIITSEEETNYECDTVRFMMATNPHPGIVRFHDISAPGAAEPYLVMDAVRGPSWHVALQLAETILWLHHGVNYAEGRANAPRRLLASFHHDLRGPNVIFDNVNRSDFANFPNVVVIDIGSAAIRPIDDSNQVVLPTRQDLQADLIGLAGITHALAHDDDPAFVWDGVCRCDNVPRGVLDSQDTDFVDMWTILVDPFALANTPGDAHKTNLLDFVDTARTRRDRALAREQSYVDLADDDAINKVSKLPLVTGGRRKQKVRALPAISDRELSASATVLSELAGFAIEPQAIAEFLRAQKRRQKCTGDLRDIGEDHRRDRVLRSTVMKRV